jgi:hypothetical protein
MQDPDRPGQYIADKHYVSDATVAYTGSTKRWN